MKTEIYKDEGYMLMGAAFEVYNEQGYGLAEEVYQESLELELDSRKIPFESKRELLCFYKGHPLKKRYVPDLLVFGCLIVELKSVTALAPEHEAQLINYLRLTRQPVGYLINFGHKDTLEWKRIIFSEYVGGINRLSALICAHQRSSMNSGILQNVSLQRVDLAGNRVLSVSPTNMPVPVPRLRPARLAQMSAD